MLPVFRPPASLLTTSMLQMMTMLTTTMMMMMMMMLAMTGCAALLLPAPPLSRDPGPGVGGRYPPVPGGSSREGSSGGREEALDKLFSLRNSLIRTLDSAFGVPAGRFYQAPSSRRYPPSCNVDDPEVIQQLFPGRFLSEFDLMQIVPRTGSWVLDSRRLPFRPQRRFVPGAQDAQGAQEFARGAQDAQGAQESARGAQAVARDHQPSDQFASNAKVSAAQFLADPGNSIPCGACATEIGYEVVETITDFTGRNHTVVNFKNAFQFIPSGRCVNELSSCGWGGSTCRQVTRAQWSLVWTAGIGVNLVAHEVPSHCECLNIGISTTASRRQDRVAASHSGDQADAAVASDLKRELLLHGAAVAEASSPQLSEESRFTGEEEEQQLRQKAEAFEQTALPLVSGQPEAAPLAGSDSHQRVPRLQPTSFSDKLSGSRKAELGLVNPLKDVTTNLKVGAVEGQEGRAKIETGADIGLLPERNSFADDAGEDRRRSNAGHHGSETKHQLVPDKILPAGVAHSGYLRQNPFQVEAKSGPSFPFIGEEIQREDTRPHVNFGVSAAGAVFRQPQSSAAQAPGQRQSPGLIIITEAPKSEVSRPETSDSAFRSSSTSLSLFPISSHPPSR